MGKRKPHAREGAVGPKNRTGEGGEAPYPSPNEEWERREAAKQQAYERFAAERDRGTPGDGGHLPKAGGWDPRVEVGRSPRAAEGTPRRGVYEMDPRMEGSPDPRVDGRAHGTPRGADPRLAGQAASV